MNLYAHYKLEIETYCTELCSRLRECVDVEASRYFSMPAMTIEQEYQALNDAYPLTRVTTVTGSDALDNCLAAFTDWYVFDDQLSRRFVHKHPGVLVIPEPHAFAEIEHLCNLINASKDNFKREIQKMGQDADTKWRAVHDKYHYLITLSLYRHINCYNAHYDSAYFNWVTRRRNKRYSANELVQQLRDSKVPKGKDPQQWKTLINDEINEIEAAGVDELIMRRQVNYRPEVNLRRGGQMNSYSAGLPIILPSMPCNVSDLTTLDVTKRKLPTRQERYQLVLPRLHMYAEMGRHVS